MGPFQEYTERHALLPCGQRIFLEMLPADGTSLALKIWRVRPAPWQLELRLHQSLDSTKGA